MRASSRVSQLDHGGALFPQAPASCGQPVRDVTRAHLVRPGDAIVVARELAEREAR